MARPALTASLRSRLRTDARSCGRCFCTSALISSTSLAAAACASLDVACDRLRRSPACDRAAALRCSWDARTSRRHRQCERAARTHTHRARVPRAPAPRICACSQSQPRWPACTGSTSQVHGEPQPTSAAAACATHLRVAFKRGNRLPQRRQLLCGVAELGLGFGLPVAHNHDGLVSLVLARGAEARSTPTNLRSAVRASFSASCLRDASVFSLRAASSKHRRCSSNLCTEPRTTAHEQSPSR